MLIKSENDTKLEEFSSSVEVRIGIRNNLDKLKESESNRMKFSGQVLSAVLKGGGRCQMCKKMGNNWLDGRIAEKYQGDYSRAQSNYESIMC